MSTAQQIVRRAELLNRRTIDRRTAAEVGKVDQLWVDPQSHRTLGFTCKSGLLGSKKRWFAWAQVDTVGENVLVNINPELPELQQPEQAISTIGLEVITDAGNKAGTVADFLFDAKTGSIVGYLFKSSGWRGVLDGIYVLPVAAISTIGSKRAIVSEAAVLEPHQYAEGLHQKMSQVAEFLHEDLDKTLKNVEGVKRGAQSLAEKLQDKAQEVKEVAQVKVAELKQQVKPEPASPEPAAGDGEVSSPPAPEADLR
ncbi:MAG: photosystem reaction center subunit H [Oscillatoriales cyanobacterium RU_3_3]|nr:photosystem reaction center subunit H [Oscillatoriales cyanobacterium RU_3_3]NJR25612.1 photosystem reaction center subunit H [Richelia sp. CSU_2_1]